MIRQKAATLAISVAIFPILFTLFIIWSVADFVDRRRR